jgi:hypothetical protein
VNVTVTLKVVPGGCAAAGKSLLDCAGPGGIGVGVGVAATTVKGTALLVTPDRDAVILAVPAATPVAKPAVEIVATPVLELSQATWDVMSAVELSE